MCDARTSAPCMLVAVYLLWISSKVRAIRPPLLGHCWCTMSRTTQNPPPQNWDACDLQSSTHLDCNSYNCSLIVVEVKFLMEQLTVKLWFCLLNLMSFQTLTIDQTKDRLTSAEPKEDIRNNVSNAFVHKICLNHHCTPLTFFASSKKLKKHSSKYLLQASSWSHLESFSATTLKHLYAFSPRTCEFGAHWYRSALAEVKQLCLNTMIRAIMNESHINYLSCGSRGLVREENGKHRQGREREREWAHYLSMRFPRRKASLWLITSLGWSLTSSRHTSCHWIACHVW